MKNNIITNLDFLKVGAFDLIKVKDIDRAAIIEALKGHGVEPNLKSNTARLGAQLRKLNRQAILDELLERFGPDHYEIAVVETMTTEKLAWQLHSIRQRDKEMAALKAQESERKDARAEKDPRGRKAERVLVTGAMKEVLAMNVPKRNKFRMLDQLGMPAMQIAELVPARPAFVYNELRGVYDRHKVQVQVEGYQITLVYTGEQQDEKMLKGRIEKLFNEGGMGVVMDSCPNVQVKKEIRNQWLEALTTEKVTNFNWKQK